MKILITGANGRVGSHLSRDLQTDGHELISIARSATGPGNHHYNLDVAEQYTEVKEIISSEKPDAVIHLASMIGPACEADPAAAERVNVTATRRLANATSKAGVSRFIFFSSAAVYQQLILAPTDEDSNIAPQSVYGRTKLAAEQAITEEATSSSDTLFTSLRVFNIYGPGFPDSLVYKLIHAEESHPVKLFAFENFYRDYIHISDVAQAVRRVLDQDSNQRHTVMNIASGQAVSTAELIEALRAGGIKPQYTLSGDDNLSVSWADIARVKAIGFRPSDTIIIDR